MTGIFRQRWHPKTRPRWIASLPVSEEVDETVSLARLAGIIITENIPGTAVEESVSLGIILRCTEREPLNINENVTLSIFFILQTNDQALVQDAFSLLRQLSEENSSSISVIYSASLDKNNGFVSDSQSIENDAISLEYTNTITISNQLNAIDIIQIDKRKGIIAEDIINTSEVVASIPDFRGLNIVNNTIEEEEVNDPEYETIPQYMLSSQGTCVEGFENYLDWSLSSGSAANNNISGQFSQGNQSVKFTAASTEQRCYKDAFGPVDVTNFERMYMDIYLHDVWEGFNIRLYDNDNHVNYIEMSPFQFCRQTINMLHKSRYPKRLATLSGMTWESPIVAMRVSQSASGVYSISMDNLILNSVGFGAGITLRFDDGYSGFYNTVFPILQAHRIRGNIALISSWVGESWALTWNQIEGLDSIGWCILNHGDINDGLEGQDLATQTSRIQTCITALEDHGLTRGSHLLVFPSASYDATSFIMMENLNIPMGIGVGSAVTNFNVHPYPDLRQVTSYTVNNTKSVAEVKTYLDTCITDKSVCTVHFHNVPDGSGEWTTAQFEEFITYVAQKCDEGVLHVLTLDDYYNLHNQSVTVPKVVL